jgi:hypothetical protein
MIVGSRRGEMNTGFWCGNPREKDHLKYLGVDGDDIKIDLQEIRSRAWFVLELSLVNKLCSSSLRWDAVLL